MQTATEKYPDMGRMFVTFTEKKGQIDEIPYSFMEVGLQGFIDRGLLTILD